ncbi:glycoside hydrolase [Sphingomonas floccifaciens]|uniref:Glycoside hydrolase n=1 Tax=Sphingomonas floccifaciens TaxID=1844115 RepID=A0ABW4N9M9_9SPHN
MKLLATALLLGAASPTITAPPPTLKVDPFYEKYVEAAGLPILSSRAVPDPALLTARSLVEGMVRHRPELARWLVAHGYRIAIMSLGEGTLDLPEQRHWKKPERDDLRLTRCERKHYDERIGRKSDADYWNNRARGMGGILTSAGAEDLLGDPYSRYYGETIFVHEFSHVLLHAIRAIDAPLYARLEAAYAAAKRDGRWTDEYALTTIDEYWAEGTQTWFESNRLTVVDGTRILGPKDLKRYDPALYAVLGKVYGRSHHLAGDPWYRSPMRIPLGPIPKNTAEVC